MELELDAQAQKTRELAVELEQTSEGWSTDSEKWNAERETMRMKLELDRLKRLEEVRRQFNKERATLKNWVRPGDEASATLIRELKEKLATLESAVPPGGPGATGEPHRVSESVSGEGTSVKEAPRYGGGKKVTFSEPAVA